MIEMKQKIYIEISGDILREKHKQKTKVKTHSWDEKKLQNMIDGEDAKTKDLQRDTWRHLEKKKITQTKD